jgi:hypothetical protein
MSIIQMLEGYCYTVNILTILPDRLKPKTIKLVFVASPLSTQYEGEKAKTGWLGIRIMCPSGATGLTMDYCFSELELLQSN